MVRHVFDDDPRFPIVVPFMPFDCPRCGSDKPRTHAVRRVDGVPTERQHVCQSCGLRYKSVEVTPEQALRWLEREKRERGERG